MSRANWGELVSHNPMLVEIARFRRKYLSMRGTGVVTTVFFGVVYGILLLAVTRFAEAVEPAVVLYTELGLLCFLAPALAYTSIAGEREKRTWDFLLVAPVTRAQIVVGKFIAAAQGVVAVALLMLVPLGVTLVGESARIARNNWTWGRDFGSSTGLYDALLAVLAIASFGIMLCALTVFFSARCRRALMALGASLGTIVFVFAIIPLLTQPLIREGFEWRFWLELLNFFNPFVATGCILDPSTYDDRIIPTAYYGWPQIGVYLAVAIGFLAWAVKTVQWPDNEVEFIGGKRARS